MNTCLGVNHLLLGHRSGDVADALAAGERGRHGAVVEHVGLEHPQVLRGPIQQLEARVLRITCKRNHASTRKITKMQKLSSVVRGGCVRGSRTVAWTA